MLNKTQIIACKYYGACFWTNSNKCKDIAIAYFKAIKRILGVRNFQSNHHVCFAADLPNFEYYTNLNIFRFLKIILMVYVKLLEIASVFTCQFLYFQRDQ